MEQSALCLLNCDFTNISFCHTCFFVCFFCDICEWGEIGVWKGADNVRMRRKMEISRQLQRFLHPIRLFHESRSRPLSSGLSLPWRWRKVAPPILPSKHSQRRSITSWKIDRRSHHFPCLQQTDSDLILDYISVLSCPKCAKLCIYRPVSVETRLEPRYVCFYFFLLFCSFLPFCAGFQISTTLRGAA